MRLKSAFVERGYSLYADSPTNQQFVILNSRQFENLSKHVAFEVWERIDEEHIAVRFVTSWATSDEKIQELIKYL